MAEQNKLLLVDGHSLAFRAFYALHNAMESMKNSAGLHTNALYGFHNMIQSKMEEIQPNYVLVAFDAGRTTFRHESFAEYKGGRDSMPAELSEQMPYIRSLLDALGISYYQLDQYEADDIIGTLAKQADEAAFETVIMTGDLDLAQLASDHTSMHYQKKGDYDTITPEFLLEKYGFRPDQVPDYLGLKGDPSDNIPGVDGVGEKRASKYLKEYGSIENLYDHMDDLKASKVKENLIEQEDRARLSKKLATIMREAPLEISLEDLAYHGKNEEKLIEFYKEMDFKSHLEKMDVSFTDQEKVEPASYEWVDHIEASMFAEQSALYVEMLGEDYHQEDIVGVAWGNEDAIYLTDIETAQQSQIFKDWLANDDYEKYVFDAKATIVGLYHYGLSLNHVALDILLADYLLTATDNREDVYLVATNHHYQALDSDQHIYGKGKKRALPSDQEVLHQHLANKILAIYSLAHSLHDELESNDQMSLHDDIELPLSKVLAQMEIRGIRVDADQLKALETEFDQILCELKSSIYEKAGEEFNLNSPKQLGEILFDKMGYPVIATTPSGNYSTSQDVLEKLQDQAPIVDDILQYRQISKIQSTYVKGLLEEIDEDGRVHTRYMQTVARTGRLSSVDPNLQNIPVRTEEGRQIRKAFTANHPDWLIFASDYSQIELRIMAHISQDEHMIKAFQEGMDIHSATAVRIFGLEDTEQVTPNMRRDAKTINFGVLYGMSDYGLSQSLGISRKEAKEFIDIYFKRYPGISDYKEKIIREAKNQGYVETIFHRRRYLPDINAKNFNQRSFAERTAVNTPIQGSAADIIKLAMIEMEKRLSQEQMESEMLLQVHDELIFQVPPAELEKMKTLVKDVMENIVDLAIPLEVENNYGDNWYTADE